MEFPQYFNSIDYAIITITLVSVAYGIYRGFVREVLALLAWVIAVSVAVTFTPELAVLLDKSPTIHELTSATSFIAFVLLFVSTLVITSLVSLVLSKILASTGLSFMNRFMGLVFGFVRGSVVIIAMVMILNFTGIVKHKFWDESFFLPYYQQAIHYMIRLLPEEYQQLAKHFEYIAPEVEKKLITLSLKDVLENSRATGN